MGEAPPRGLPRDLLMAGPANILNWALFVVLWLLVTRLLILNWGRGGAFLLPLIVFVSLVLAYDILIAGIAVVLILLFVPTVSRSPLGAALHGLLVAATDPIVDVVRRLSGDRVAGGPAIVIAALLVVAMRFALLPALRP